MDQHAEDSRSPQASFLERNLAILDRVDPPLAARVRLPVSSDHVRRLAPGRALYQLHRSSLPLELSRPLAAEVPPGESLVVLGLGLGEGLALALEGPAGRVLAWERDPWLLRLTLAGQDLGPSLESGRLKLLLGADLVELWGLDPLPTEWIHPLLGSIYRDEIELVRSSGRGSRALVVQGGLFVDDLVRCLRGRGLGVYRLDVARLATEESEHAVSRLEPQLLCGINYANGTAEFCHRQGLAGFCWEIDPHLCPPAPLAEPEAAFRIYTYRRAHLETYRDAGFCHVDYAPLAAHPDGRAPVDLARFSPAERERYQAPLSFVGSSVALNVERFRRRFCELYRSWRGGAEEALLEAEQLLREVLAQQRAEPTVYRIPELLAERCPGFDTELAAQGERVSPTLLAAEIAASEKRIGTVANLGAFGIRTWGDRGWKLAERFGARYMGSAGHALELNKIYSGSLINVDIGRIYQDDIVTMRVFDVLACGGFVLAEHSPAVEELFEIGRELETWRDLGELQAKVAHYFEFPDQARALAARGRAAVLERHSFPDRVDGMLDAVLAPSG